MSLSGHRPVQRPDELAAFIDLLVAEGVSSYLEIGSRHGDALHAVALALPVGSRVVSVDLPMENKFRDAKRNLKRAIADLNAHGYDAHVIFGNSHDRETRDRAAALGPYDAVFIDAGHRLADVSADWRDYGPLGRIVGFHDIDTPNHVSPADRKRFSHFAVHEFWNGLKGGFRHIEILGEERGMGIGVLWQA